MDAFKFYASKSNYRYHEKSKKSSMIQLFSVAFGYTIAKIRL